MRNDFPVSERGLLTMTVAGGSALACVFDLATKKQRSAIIRAPSYIWEATMETCVSSMFII